MKKGSEIHWGPTLSGGEYLRYFDLSVLARHIFYSHRVRRCGCYSQYCAAFGGTDRFWGITILSRKALEDIGGFYTGSITEDFATGLLIEAKGYVSLALPMFVLQELCLRVNSKNTISTK